MSSRHLVLSPAQRRRLAKDAAAAAPQECCGILFGTRQSPQCTSVSRVVATENVSLQRERGFEIAPGEMLAAYSDSVRAGEELVGFYHSHPEGAPRLSPRDRQSAWLGLSQVVVGAAGELASWRCRADGTVESELIVDRIPERVRA